jgi:hypothetical protein
MLWGGYPKNMKKKSPLKLIEPNGGEEFIVGCDSLIKWQGLLPADTVTLSYSIDKGKNWNLISDTAHNHIYKWKNIPNPASNKCLMKVEKYFNEGWSKTVGYEQNDAFYDIAITSDGGYITVGYSDNDSETAYYFITKFNSKGEVEWDKKYGGWDNPDIGYSVIQTMDGGYLVGGWAASSTGDVANNNPFQRDSGYWILKLDKDGNIIWKKNYGGDGNDQLKHLIQTTDGNYMAIGNTDSKNGDVSEHFGEDDIWLLKLDHAGNILKEKSFGGSKSERALVVRETNDGGIIFAGMTASSDGDVPKNIGERDIWVVKLDHNENIQWSKVYGSQADERGLDIVIGKNGGYLLCGIQKITDENIYIIKIDDAGNIEWENTYGGSGNDSGYGAMACKDNGYIITGTTNSIDGDIKNSKGGNDAFVLKLDDKGNIQWFNNYGGSGNDVFITIKELYEENYIISGFSTSADGDLKENQGKADGWLFRLDMNQMNMQDISDNLWSIVSPNLDITEIDMGKEFINKTKDSVINKIIKNNTKWNIRIDSIYIQGPDKDYFKILSYNSEYVLNKNDFSDIEIRFSPTIVKKYNAELIIITQTEKIVSKIKGEGIDSYFSLLNKYIDFGKVGVGSIKDSLVLTIKNTSSTPLTILKTKHNLPNINDFSTIIGQGPFTLQGGEEHRMTLQFAPTTIGRTSGNLEFHIEGVLSPEIIYLFGEGVENNKVTAVLKTTSHSQFPNKKIDIPVILHSRGSINYNLAESYSTTLGFNPTILHPVNYKYKKINDSLATIDLTNLDIKANVGDTLKNIKFMVGVGNAVACELTLSGSQIIGGNSDVSEISGHFNLLGICEEGGTRLIEPNTTSGITHIYPNPVKSNIEIDLSLIEKGYTELVIYDSMGKNVKTIFAHDIEKFGKMKIKKNLSDLPYGIYYLTYKSPTVYQIKKIVVVN